ncbi:MAG: hypothetical protein IT245_03215, partial [Bacteroidia bacterium]|nr:hypothetical protein [Bacteroidia bacterium]
MKYLYSILFLIVFSNAFAQGPILTGLNNNPILKKHHPINKKRSINDTITLPFIDDFTSTEVFPNSIYWMDRQVFINSTFPVSAPSYGVATFDNLDHLGRPYQALNGNTHNHCDSLTSNPINLLYYTSGLSKVLYSISDSIYLSFFYQTQGLGDPLDNSDSLVLKFKDSLGFWKTVWKVSGTSLKPFKQVLVPILDLGYLSNRFQFRFINYGKSTGNMNQWHIDYVRMDKARNQNDTIINDVAINQVPTGPLSYYESMPYDHFKANPAFHTNNQLVLNLRNNNANNLVNFNFAYQVINQYNKLV